MFVDFSFSEIYCKTVTVNSYVGLVEILVNLTGS